MSSENPPKKLSHAPDPGDVTLVLGEIAAGREGAVDRLIELVKADLRKQAAWHLSGSPAWKTLQPTGLVHEAYLRIFGKPEPPRWEHRGHFYTVVSTAMHDVLVERARAAVAKKRGGGHNRVPLREDLAQIRDAERFLGLDEALKRLATTMPLHVEIIRLRFYAGMTIEQIADVTGRSARSVARDWQLARAWLHEQLSDEDGAGPDPE